MASAIPQAARAAVRIRESHRCARCLVPAPNGQWHHRRSRLVRDAHQHCTCNGVWLCATCHAWVHHNPIAARDAGFIISKFVTDPGIIPIEHPLGLRYQDCEGRVRYDNGTIATDP